MKAMNTIIGAAFLFGLQSNAQDTAPKANEKINSALGSVKVQSKISKCAAVNVEPFKIAEPMPTDYQLEITAKSLKSLSACGCKKQTNQAFFSLQNGKKGVIQTQEWWVTSPSGGPVKYTMNLPTSQSNIITSPLTLKVCCIGDKCR